MIDTIIFDFAGVVTKTGFLKTLIQDLKKSFDFDEAIFQKRFAHNEAVYMTGNMTDEEFWEIACAGFDIPYEQYRKIFVSAFEFNPEVTSLINDLKTKYHTVLLSDNCDLLSGALRKNPEFMDLFHEVFFSNEIGFIKKTPGCFEYVLEKLGKKPTECVFIDDKQGNLDPATALGMPTILFTSASDLKQSLTALGVVVDNN